MKKHPNSKRSVVVAASALALCLSTLALPQVAAAASHGGSEQGQHGAQGHGQGHGGMATDDRGLRGGNRDIGDILSEDDDGGDDDSDRPDWAGGDKEENPHRGEGNPSPGVPKGVDYGDVWVILRDDLGNPILDDNGNVQPCLDMACEEYVQLTEDGELPPEYADQVIAVEFGRLNISRSPASVLEHSLVEALLKLDGGVFGDTVTLDPAGRLVIDGSTIDSPLENLALYQALLTAPAVDGIVTLSITTTVEGEGEVTLSFSIPESVRLDLAASAIAAASDKTGELTIDEVVNISKFLGVDDELAALVGDYTYDREETYGDVQVWIMAEVAPGIFEPVLVNVIDEVSFNETPSIDDDDNGIDRFAQAADDSVQVLEYVHDGAIDQ